MMAQPTLMRAFAVAIFLYTAFASLLGTLVMLARDEVAGGMVSAVRGARLSRTSPKQEAFRGDARQALAADTTLNPTDAGVCHDRYGYLRNHTSLEGILAHADELRRNAPPVVRALKEKRYFIAALMHNNQAVFTFWQRELIKVVATLANERWDNIYVSVSESGSEDLTKVVLLGLDNLLESLGVPHTINLDELKQEEGVSQAQRLAALRNNALASLYASEQVYDEVLYLNDIFFCASDLLDLLRLVRSHGADYTCSVDFIAKDPESKFDRPRLYDTWVARDLLGNNLVNEAPHFCDEASQKQFEAGEPFQVFSCWNGMVAIKADVFQELGVRFRGTHAYECRLSECDLLVRDLWALGRNKVVMVPTARTAYDWDVFTSLLSEARAGVPMDYKGSFEAIAQAPKEVSCCALDDVDHKIRFEKCFHDANWQLPYETFGVPLAPRRGAVDADMEPIPKDDAALLQLVLAKSSSLLTSCEEHAARLRIPNRFVHAIGTPVTKPKSDDHNVAALARLSFIARHPCWAYEPLDDLAVEAAALREFAVTAKRLGYARNLGLRVDLLRLAYLVSRGGVLLPPQGWGVGRIDTLLRPEDSVVVGVAVDRATGERFMLFLAAVPGAAVLMEAVEEALRLVAEPDELYNLISTSPWCQSSPEDRERYHGAGLGLVLSTIEAQGGSDRSVRVVEYELPAVAGIVGKPEETCAAATAREALVRTGLSTEGWAQGPMAFHKGATDGAGGGYRASRLQVQRASEYDHLRSGHGLMEGQYIKTMDAAVFIPTDPYWESPPLTQEELGGWDPADGLFLWVPYGGKAGIYAGNGPLDPRHRLLRKLCPLRDRQMPAVPHLTMLVLQTDHNLVLYAEPTNDELDPAVTLLWTTETVYKPPPPPPHMPLVKLSKEPPPAFLALRADGRLAMYKGTSPQMYQAVQPYSHPNFLPFEGNAPGMRKGTHPSLVLLGTAKGGTSDFHQLILARYCHLFNAAQVKELDGLRYTGGYAGRIAFEHITAGEPHGLPIPALDMTKEEFAMLNKPYDFQKFVGNEVYLWRLNATGPLPYTIDATPTYLDWGPSDAVNSIISITNSSNIMVFLREPVSRTHSLYNHWLIMRDARGEEIPADEMSFEQEIAMQLNYFEEPTNRNILRTMLETDNYRAASLARDKMQREIKVLLGKLGTDYYSPLLSSVYLPALMLWAENYFQHGRVLIIQSDTLFTNKQTCMEQVVAPFIFSDLREREFVPQCAGNYEAMYKTDTRKQFYHRLAAISPELKCNLHKFFKPFNDRLLTELRALSSKVHVWPPVDSEEGPWWGFADERYCGEAVLKGSVQKMLT